MTSHAALLERYKSLRKISRRLSDRLAERLSKSALLEGGQKLGIVKNNQLILDTEDEICVLMDYCIHDVRNNEVNGVEQYLVDFPPPLGSDERTLLEALRDARFVVFLVEAREDGVGVAGRDLLRDEPLFIFDVGFGQTSRSGLVLVSRIIAPEGIHMTTGAGLPMGVLSPQKRAQFVATLKAELKGQEFDGLSKEAAGLFAARVIRTCLQAGAAERIRYDDPADAARPAPMRPARPEPAVIGRNDPCPCGSGKKFKRCCGARGG